MAETFCVTRQGSAGGSRTCSMADPTWLSTLFKSLNMLYRKGMFCDTTLMTSDGQVFSAHACMLAASSPVLYNVMENTKQGDLMVTLNNISKDAWMAILDFVYQGQVDVPENKLLEVLEAARLLQLTQLTTLCENLQRCKTMTGEFPRPVNWTETTGISCDGQQPVVPAVVVKQEKTSPGSTSQHVLPAVSEGMAEPSTGPTERIINGDIRTGEVPTDDDAMSDQDGYDSTSESDDPEALDLSQAAQPPTADQSVRPLPPVEPAASWTASDAEAHWVHVNEDDVLDLSNGKGVTRAALVKNPQCHNMILDLSQKQLGPNKGVDLASEGEPVFQEHMSRGKFPDNASHSGSTEKVIKTPMVSRLHPGAALRQREKQQQVMQVADGANSGAILTDKMQEGCLVGGPSDQTNQGPHCQPSLTLLKSAGGYSFSNQVAPSASPGVGGSGKLMSLPIANPQAGRQPEAVNGQPGRVPPPMVLPVCPPAASQQLTGVHLVPQCQG